MAHCGSNEPSYANRQVRTRLKSIKKIILKDIGHPIAIVPAAGQTSLIFQSFYLAEVAEQQ